MKSYPTRFNLDHAVIDISAVKRTAGNRVPDAGLVASLNRPGGNMTGLNLLMIGLIAKRLELLHELVPKAESIGLLVNPNNPGIERDKTEMDSAARVLGKQALIVRA